MVKLRGFRFSLNLSALNNKQKEFDDYPYQPQYSTITGAYKINNNEFIAPTSSLPQVNRIRPSMIKLPSSGEPKKDNMDNLKPNIDDSQGNSSYVQTESVKAVKSILKTQQTSQESSTNSQVGGDLIIRQGNDDYLAPPPMVPKSETIVSKNPKGAESSKAIKQTTKEQKKLEKNQEKERKLLEKQQVAEAKKEEMEKKKRQQELKKQQEKDAKMAMQKERVNKNKKNKTLAPKPQANKRAANPLAQSNNPLAQTPQPSTRTVDPAPVQSTTPESTLSRTKGPPPYSEVVNNLIAPEVMQSQIDPTGNTSFGKPVDLGSWDLISQHRQQIGRPAKNTAMLSGAGKSKQIVMDLNFQGNAPHKSVYI